MGIVRLTRRHFLQTSAALAGLGLLTSCAAKVPRIGYLSQRSATQGPLFMDELRQGLAEHGYVEGQNIAIDVRFSEGRDERLPDLVAELVGLNVAAILAASPTSVRAAQQVTNTTPIVMVGASEVPVEMGLVASLAKPGGNVTGSTIGGGLEVPGKRLQLLQQPVPGLSRVAILGDATDFPFEKNPKFGPLDAAARSLGLQLQVVNVRTPEEFEGAFAAMRSEGAEALYVDPSPLIGFNRAKLAELTIQHRLPSIHASSAYADAGLMTYGANVPDLWRRSATYLDKIIKGTKPADLPVERPTKFDFILNLKMAQALGLTIPQAMLAEATQVIQ